MQKSFVAILCVISLLLLSGGLNVCASTTYEFETINLPKDDMNQVWKNINVKKYLIQYL